MATTPDNAEPGFEPDMDELPEDQLDDNVDTLEDDLNEDDEEPGDIEHVQEEAADERKKGGYQQRQIGAEAETGIPAFPPSC